MITATCVRCERDFRPTNRHDILCVACQREVRAFNEAAGADMRDILGTRSHARQLAEDKGYGDD